MNNFSPTPAQKIAVLKEIRYEIESLLGTPNYDSADEVILETVYFRKMAHGRALHTFFTTPTPNRWKNDVLSEDYAFTALAIFQPLKAEELLERFNQALFHISYSRVRRTPGDKAWPIEEFLPPIIDRSKAFVSHVLSLRWPNIPKEEQLLWDRMLTPAYVRIPLAQSTSNIAVSQVASVERFIRGT